MKGTGRYLDAAETAHLARTLTADVLENLVRMPKSRVYTGRETTGRAFRSYEELPRGAVFTGLFDWDLPLKQRHINPGIATVLKGELYAEVGDNVYHARGGDWLVLAPGVPHREYCLPTRHAYSMIWFLQWPNSKIVTTRYTPRNGFLIEIYQTRLRPAPNLATRIEETLATRNVAVEELRELVLHLVVWWLDVIKTAEREDSGQIHPIVARIQRLFQQFSKKPLSVNQMARMVGVSPSYLSRVFYRSTGQHLGHLMQVSRIERAKEFLMNPSMSIKEIAFVLGFSNQQHLTHMFHRIVGVTPSTFRQELPRAFLDKSFPTNDDDK